VHDDENCWQFHPKKRPKWFKERKGRKNVATTTRPRDLGSDSSESKITAVGLSGKIGDGFDSRSKLFHIRVIMKHTKIETLIDSGSQSNLISKEVFKKLGLNPKMHHKPYSLNWISKYHKFLITKQCIIKFAITSKYVNEVICDVVPLETCGMVLGNPYLYDHKEIFYDADPRPSGRDPHRIILNSPRAEATPLDPYWNLMNLIHRSFMKTHPAQLNTRREPYISMRPQPGLSTSLSQLKSL
jgi:hypothetical protein